MTRRVIPSRGLSGLRTLTGRNAGPVPRYKAYLQISFLELERARHSQEIRTAQARVERMLDRCREIETEKAAILAAAGEQASPPTPAHVPSMRTRRPRFGVSY